MISVIVPYWNSEKWLGRCCESLMKQQGEFEFLLISDHCTDRSDDIARGYAEKDRRFQALQNAHSKGVSGARNTGLDAAKGEWVTFLDADDEMLPDAWEVFERMTRLGGNVMQSNHLRYYAIKDLTKLKYANERKIYHLCDIPFSRYPACWCMVWNKLIKRSFIEEHQIRFVEGLQYGEDEIFNLTLCKYDDRLFHTKHDTVTVLRHFDNKQSLSRIKANDWFGLVKQSQALERFMIETDDPKLRHSVYQIIAEHWNSSRYKEAFKA